MNSSRKSGRGAVMQPFVKKSIFKYKSYEIWYNGALVLTGKDIGQGGLWILPIDVRTSLDEEKLAEKMQNPPSDTAAAVHTLP